MRCFTVTTRLENGIRVSEKPYPHIAVGEAGRGRKLSRVALGSRDFDPAPETLTNASVMQTRKGTILVVAEQPHDHRRALVLLSTPMGYRGSTSWEGLDDVVVLAEGIVADGAAGRMGSYLVRLVIVEPGTRLVCHRRGRLYGKPSEVHVCFTGDELLVGTADEVCPPSTEADDTDGELL